MFDYNPTRAKNKLKDSHPKIAKLIDDNWDQLREQDREFIPIFCEQKEGEIRADKITDPEASIYGVGTFSYFKEQIGLLIEDKKSEIKPGLKQKAIIEDLIKINKKKGEITYPDWSDADLKWRQIKDEDKNFQGMAFQHFCDLLGQSLKGSKESKPKPAELPPTPAPKPAAIFPPPMPTPKIPDSITLAYAKRDARYKVNVAASRVNPLIPKPLKRLESGAPIPFYLQFKEYFDSPEPELLPELFFAYDSKDLTTEHEAVDAHLRTLDKPTRKLLYVKLMKTGHKWKYPKNVEAALMMAAPEILIDQLEICLNDSSYDLELIYNLIIENKKHFLANYKKMTLSVRGFQRLHELFELLKKRKTLFFLCSEVAVAVLENMSEQRLIESLCYCLINEKSLLAIFRWCNTKTFYSAEPNNQRHQLLNDVLVRTIIDLSKHEKANLKNNKKLQERLIASIKAVVRIFGTIGDAKVQNQIILQVVSHIPLTSEIKSKKSEKTDSSPLFGELPAEPLTSSSSLESVRKEKKIEVKEQESYWSISSPLEVVNIEQKIEAKEPEPYELGISENKYWLVYKHLASLLLDYFEKHKNSNEFKEFADQVFEKIIEQGRESCYFLVAEIICVHISTPHVVILKNQLLDTFSLKIAAEFKTTLLEFMRPNSKQLTDEYQSLFLDALSNTENMIQRTGQALELKQALLNYGAQRAAGSNGLADEQKIAECLKQANDSGVLFYIWEQNFENTFSGYAMLRWIFSSLPDSLYGSHSYQNYVDIDISRIVERTRINLKMDKWSVAKPSLIDSRLAFFLSLQHYVSEKELVNILEFLENFLDLKDFNELVTNTEAANFYNIYSSLTNDLRRTQTSNSLSKKMIAKCLADKEYAKIPRTKSTLVESKVCFVKTLLNLSDEECNGKTKGRFAALVRKQEKEIIEEVLRRHRIRCLEILSANPNSEITSYDGIGQYINVPDEYIQQDEESYEIGRKRLISSFSAPIKEKKEENESKAEPNEEHLDIPSIVSAASLWEAEDKAVAEEDSKAKDVGSRLGFSLDLFPGSTLNHLLNFVRSIYKSRETSKYFDDYVLKILKNIGFASMPIRCFFEIMDMTNLWNRFLNEENHEAEEDIVECIRLVASRSSTQAYKSLRGFRTALEIWLLIDTLKPEDQQALSEYLEFKWQKNQKDIVTLVTSEFSLGESSNGVISLLRASDSVFSLLQASHKNKEVLKNTFYFEILLSINKYVLFANTSYFATFALIITNNDALIDGLWQNQNILEAKHTFLKQLVKHVIFQHELIKNIYQKVILLDAELSDQIISLQSQVVSLFIRIITSRQSEQLHQLIAREINFENRIFVQYLVSRDIKYREFPRCIKDALRLTILQQGLRQEHSLLPKGYFNKLSNLTLDYYSRREQKKDGVLKSLEELYGTHEHPVPTLDFLFAALGFVGEKSGADDNNGNSIEFKENGIYTRAQELEKFVVQGWRQASLDKEEFKRNFKLEIEEQAILLYFNQPDCSFLEWLSGSVSWMIYFGILNNDEIEDSKYICLKVLTILLNPKTNDENILQKIYSIFLGRNVVDKELKYESHKSRYLELIKIKSRQYTNQIKFFDHLLYYLAERLKIDTTTVNLPPLQLKEIPPSTVYSFNLITICAHFGIIGELLTIEKRSEEKALTLENLLTDFAGNVAKEFHFRLRVFRERGGENNPFCAALFMAKMVTIFQLVEMIKWSYYEKAEYHRNPPLTLDCIDRPTDEIFLGFSDKLELKEAKTERNTDTDFFKILVILTVAQTYGPEAVEHEMIRRALSLLNRNCATSQPWDGTFFKLIALAKLTGNVNFLPGLESYQLSKHVRDKLRGNFEDIFRYVNLCNCSPSLNQIIADFDSKDKDKKTQVRAQLSKYFESINHELQQRELLKKSLLEISELKPTINYESEFFIEFLKICFAGAGLESKMEKFVSQDLKATTAIQDKIRYWTFIIIKQMPWEKTNGFSNVMVLKFLNHLGENQYIVGVCQELMLLETAQEILRNASPIRPLSSWINKCDLDASIKDIYKKTQDNEWLFRARLYNAIGMVKSKLVFSEIIKPKELKDQQFLAQQPDQKISLAKEFSAFPIIEAFYEVLKAIRKEECIGEIKDYVSENAWSLDNQIAMAQILLADYPQFFAADQRELLYQFIINIKNTPSAFLVKAKEYSDKSLEIVKANLTLKNSRLIYEILAKNKGLFAVVNEHASSDHGKSPRPVHENFIKEIFFEANNIINKETFNPYRLLSFHNIFQNLNVINIKDFEVVFSQNEISLSSLRILFLLWQRSQMPKEERSGFIEKYLQIEFIDNLISYEVSAEGGDTCFFIRTLSLYGYLSSLLPDEISNEDQQRIEQIQNRISLKQSWKNNPSRQMVLGASCAEVLMEGKANLETTLELARRFDFVLTKETLNPPPFIGKPEERFLNFLCLILGPHGQQELQKKLHGSASPSVNQILELISKAIALLNPSQRWDVWSTIIVLLEGNPKKYKGSKFHFGNFLQQLKNENVKKLEFFNNIIVDCLSAIQDNLEDQSDFDVLVKRKQERMAQYASRFMLLWRRGAEAKDLLPIFKQVVEEIEDDNLELAFYIRTEAAKMQRILEEDKKLEKVLIFDNLSKEIAIAAQRHKRQMLNDAHKILSCFMSDDEIASNPAVWEQKIGHNVANLSKLMSYFIRWQLLDKALGVDIADDGKNINVDTGASEDVIEDFKKLLDNRKLFSMPLVEKQTGGSIGKIEDSNYFRFEDIFNSEEPAAVCFFRYFLTAGRLSFTASENDQCLDWIRSGFELNLEIKTKPDAKIIINRVCNLIFHILRGLNQKETRAFKITESKKSKSTKKLNQKFESAKKLEQYAKFFLNKLLLEWNLIVQRKILEIQSDQPALKKYSEEIIEIIRIVFNCYRRDYSLTIDGEPTPILSYQLRVGASDLDGSLNALYQLCSIYISNPGTYEKEARAFMEEHYWQHGSKTFSFPGPNRILMLNELPLKIDSNTLYLIDDKKAGEYIAYWYEFRSMAPHKLLKSDNFAVLKEFFKPKHIIKRDDPDFDKISSLFGYISPGLTATPTGEEKTKLLKKLVHFPDPADTSDQYLIITDTKTSGPLTVEQLVYENLISDEKYTENELKQFKILANNMAEALPNHAEQMLIGNTIAHIDNKPEWVGRLLNGIPFPRIPSIIYAISLGNTTTDTDFINCNKLILVNDKLYFYNSTTHLTDSISLSNYVNLITDQDVNDDNVEPGKIYFKKRDDRTLEYAIRATGDRIYRGDLSSDDLEIKSFTDPIIQQCWSLLPKILLKFLAKDYIVPNQSLIEYCVSSGANILNAQYFYFKKWLYFAQLCYPDAVNLNDFYQVDSRHSTTYFSVLDFKEKEKQESLIFYEKMWNKSIAHKRKLIAELTGSDNYLVGLLEFAFNNKIIIVKEIKEGCYLHINQQKLIQLWENLCRQIGVSGYRQFGADGIFEDAKDISDLLEKSVLSPCVLHQLAEKTMSKWQDKLNDKLTQNQPGSPAEILKFAVAILAESVFKKSAPDYLSTHCQTFTTESKRSVADSVKIFFDVFAETDSRVQSSYLQCTLLWAVEQWKKSGDITLISDLLLSLCHRNLNIAAEELLISKLLENIDYNIATEISRQLLDCNPSIHEWTLVEKYCGLDPKTDYMKSLNGTGLIALSPFVEQFSKESKVTAFDFFCDKCFDKSYNTVSLIALILQKLGANENVVLIACRNLKVIQTDLLRYLINIKAEFLKTSGNLYSKARCKLDFLITLLQQNLDVGVDLCFAHGEIPLDPTAVMKYQMKETELEPRKKEWYELLHIKCLTKSLYIYIENKEKAQKNWDALTEEKALEDQTWLPVFYLYNIFSACHQFIKESYDLFLTNPINGENWQMPITNFLQEMGAAIGYSIFPPDQKPEEYVTQIIEVNNSLPAFKRYNKFSDIFLAIFDGMRSLFFPQLIALTWPATALSINDQGIAVLRFEDHTFLSTKPDQPLTLRNFFEICVFISEENHRLLNIGERDPSGRKELEYSMLAKFKLDKETQLQKRKIHTIFVVKDSVQARKPGGAIDTRKTNVINAFSKTLIIVDSDNKQINLGCVDARRIYKAATLTAAHKEAVMRGEYILLYEAKDSSEEKPNFSLGFCKKKNKQFESALLIDYEREKVNDEDKDIVKSIDMLPEGYVGVEHNDIRRAVYGACRIFEGQTGFYHEDYDFVELTITDQTILNSLEPLKDSGGVISNLDLQKMIMESAVAPFKGTSVKLTKRLAINSGVVITSSSSSSSSLSSLSFLSSSSSSSSPVITTSGSGPQPTASGSVLSTGPSFLVTASSAASSAGSSSSSSSSSSSPASTSSTAPGIADAGTPIATPST
ncbi:MAG: hypothetical protein JSR33_00315 [Proteobacteria bacterium]|nr:hypothetical protein [Pseudomonadota bacterium]